MGAIRGHADLLTENGAKPYRQIPMFGALIDAVTMPQTVDQLYAWINARDPFFRYVVTPNVDHTVMLRYDVNLQRAYECAAMVIPDGAPLIWASRLLKKPLPERVAGSDLIPEMFTAAKKKKDGPLTVFLLGAAEGVGKIAAEKIHAKWENVEVVGVYSPPLGFETNDFENDKILAMIEETHPDMLVVGLGAPKQEIWVHQHRKQIVARTAFCVGATIDFLAGHRSRAPIWMQKTGLEWLYRVLSEPRRLVNRYALDAWIFPQLVWREWQQSHAE